MLPSRLLRFHKRTIILTLLVCFSLVWLFVFFFKEPSPFQYYDGSANANQFSTNVTIPILQIPSEAEVKSRAIQEKVNRMSVKVKQHVVEKLSNIEPLKEPNYNVYIFYYGWYRSMPVDKVWKHWNHEFLPSWKRDEEYKIQSTGTHDPPSDIGSNYYPELGCYSSRNLTVIDIHMAQIRKTGIGVVIVSWYSSEFEDSPEDIILHILNIAHKYKLKVTLHIEPYPNRTPITLYKHIKYLTDKYSFHPAFHKMYRQGIKLPVYFIYDSYRTPSMQWSELLGRHGNLSIRGTIYDGVFLSLFVDLKHRYEVKKSNFDGFYTYFAVNGFTYGSSWKNWKGLSKFALDNNLIFIPCVGPGYTDTAVRPWNSANTRHRLHGHYYEVAWRSVLGAKATSVAITSFNEWHEGTQIEPAVSKKTQLFTYLDYEPEGSLFYLNLTQWWVKEFTDNSNVTLTKLVSES